MLAASQVALMVFAPLLPSATRQKAAVFIWLAVSWTLFSVLVAIFRVKYPGENTTTYQLSVTDSDLYRLSVQTVAVKIGYLIGCLFLWFAMLRIASTRPRSSGLHHLSYMTVSFTHSAPLLRPLLDWT